MVKLDTPIDVKTDGIRPADVYEDMAVTFRSDVTEVLSQFTYAVVPKRRGAEIVQVDEDGRPYVWLRCGKFRIGAFLTDLVPA